MEQQLNATYLSPEPIERAAAIGIGAVAIGIGILLSAWGISFLWRYTPPDIVVRQDKPFIVTPSEPFKIEPSIPSGVPADTKTTAGDVIRREVTVFSHVRHGPGSVVTGWSYRDGSGGVPVQQYCYYTIPNLDYSSKRVNIASNRIRSPNIDAALVPDLEGAFAKCQWWQA
jgi:hypothetical protein